MMVSVLALAVAAAIPTAAPAGASPGAKPLVKADKSACTHDFSGPQVCIRMSGDAMYTRVTGFWSNPPKSVKSRKTWLTSDGSRTTEVETATRAGETISHSWGRGANYEGARVCVHFKGIDRAACMDAPI